MDQGQYLIDELCRLSGFSRRTVRYYVQEGLVNPPAARGRGGYYSEVHVRQLARIRELQERGYRLEAIRGLLAGAENLGKREVPGSWNPPFAEIRGPEAATPAAPELPGLQYPRALWSRIALAPGVELHISAEAEQRLGPATVAALKSLRSIIQKEGGSNE